MWENQIQKIFTTQESIPFPDIIPQNFEIKSNNTSHIFRINMEISKKSMNKDGDNFEEEYQKDETKEQNDKTEQNQVKTSTYLSLILRFIQIPAVSLRSRLRGARSPSSRQPERIQRRRILGVCS